jgi:hypothetical protein
MRDRIVALATIDLTKRASLLFIVTFSSVVLVDSTIVRFSSFSGIEPIILVNITIFGTFFAIFIATSTLIIKSVRKLVSRFEYKLVSPFSPRYFYYVIAITIITTFVMILTILLQMIFLHEYSLALLRIQTYISHVSAFFFLSFLVFLLIRWLTLRRNYVVILFAVSLSLLSATLIISLAYVDSNFSVKWPAYSIVRPLPLISYVISVGTTPNTETLSTLFDVLSLSSFLVMWLATAILLSQYRFRMGGWKFYAVICIPLIYYIFPFQSYFGDLLFPLLISSPLIFSTVYVLIFSATRQVGAIFFGLTFWFASGLVYDDRIRRSLLVCSIGITILFSSIALSPLRYATYPPYGLITEVFLPLGAYMLLVGIFTSAIHVSRDAVVRKELYKTAVSQLDLLKSIGTSEMEKEFEGRVKYLMKLHRFSEEYERSFREEQMEVENVKKILHDVLDEVYSSKIQDKK